MYLFLHLVTFYKLSTCFFTGVNNSHVTYNDNGAISVTYTNHQACGDNDFTTEIILTCDFEQHHTCADAITPVGLKVRILLL